MTLEHISWDHYRTFLAVLQTGSLSQAARVLGLTQPTAGRHIEALELAFGAPLFLRSPQGLLPTEKALAMQDHARGMAAMETKAHLDLLVARGQAVRSTDADGVVWYSAAG